MKPAVFLFLGLALLALASAGCAEPLPPASVTETLMTFDGYVQVTESRTCAYDERGLLTAMELQTGERPVSCRFYYEYDVRGNPKTCTVVTGEDTSARRAVTLTLRREYEGDVLTAVRGESAPEAELWRILERFTGCADAEVDDGVTLRQYRTGLCVRERTAVGDPEGDSFQEVLREYEGDRLVRETTLTTLDGAETFRRDVICRPDGLPASVTTAAGGSRSELVFAYAPGTDEEGLPCQVGTPEGASAEESPVRVLGYFGSDGRLRRLILADGNRFTAVSFDSLGRPVQEESCTTVRWSTNWDRLRTISYTDR